MLGPHFYFDLIRLARKRSNYYLRCGFLVALLIGWWYVYEASVPVRSEINEYAKLATNFTYALLAFQYAMIFLVTPLYLAGTIAEEIESRTIELIFQTQLTDREILLGKFAARVVHVTYLGFLSLPMLAIITLWGGIDMELLAFHFACLLLLILVLSSACLWMSVTTRRYLDAVIASYALTAGTGYVGGFAAAVVLSMEPGTMTRIWIVLGMTTVSMAVVYFFYRRSLWELHRLRDRTWAKKVQDQPERPTRKRPSENAWPKANRPNRTVSEHALLWKEQLNCWSVNAIPPLIVWIGFAGACVLCIIGLLVRFNGGPLKWDDRALLGGFYLSGYLYLVGFVFVLQALDTTASVARERERNTLEYLLLPVNRSEVLFWKAVGPWVSNRLMVGMLIGLPLMAMMSGVFTVSQGLVVMLLPWPSLMFVNALGLLLSVLCRRVLTAYVALLTILIAIGVAHLLRFSDFILMVKGVGWLAGMDQHLDENREYAIGLFLGEQCLLLLLAGVCLVLAFWLFGRKSR